MRKFILLLFVFILGYNLMFASSYYCDPNNGSMSNSGTSTSSAWSTLQAVFEAGKTFSGGDVIYLMDGFHGYPSVNGDNSSNVTIQPYPGESPTLQGLIFESASYWIATGLDISREHASGTVTTRLVWMDDDSPHITIDNCNVYCASEPWATTAEWTSNIVDGIKTVSDYTTITNNHIYNIAGHGIALTNTDNSLIEGNLIENIGHDGIQGQGSYHTIQYNTIQECYNIDSNHDDGIQFYSVGTDGSVGSGNCISNIIRGNTIISIVDSNRDLTGNFQGIGGFDGLYTGWIIENNLIMTEAYHGISLYGAIDCYIVNNTLVDTESGNTSSWIKTTAHKNGTPATGNYIANNLASNISCDAGSATFASNIEISHSEYASHFVDWEGFDCSLISTSDAIDAGTSANAPDTDILGATRPAGNGYDVGAYEFDGEVEPKLTVTPSSLTLNPGQTSALTATVSPEDGSSITWSSDNTAVATVNENTGVVTAEGIGIATITAESSSNLSDDCQVTVTNELIDLALNTIATVSSEASGLPASYAVDGDASTRWGSNYSDPQYIYVDLGASYSISTVVLSWETAYASEYEIQVSDDASSWTTIYTTASGTGGEETITDLSGAGQYVRMYGTARGTSYGYSLYAFEVYGGDPGPDPVTDVVVDPTSASIAVGGTYQLSATVQPSTATQTVTWESDAMGVASVDDDGLVSAISVGTATITVKSTEDTTIYDECVITVTAADEDLALNKTVAASSEATSYPASYAVDGDASTRWGSDYSDPQYIYVDLEASYEISTVVLSWETAYASEYEIQVSDDASSWATIYSTTSGTGGEETISGLSGSGQYVRMYGTARGTSWGYSLYAFEVYGAEVDPDPDPDPVTSVTLNTNAITLNPGDTYQLSATVEPSTATQTVSWGSDATDYTTVDDNGLVTAISANTATIRVTSTEDTTIYDECIVTVEEEPEPDPDPVTVTLSPTDDAYVRGSSFADTNYGTATKLAVKDNSSTYYLRESLLKFDLSDISSASSAILRLYVSTLGGTTTHIISLCDDDSWTEDAVTYNTKPSASSTISSYEVSASGAYIEIDITTAVQSELGDDISLFIVDDGSGVYSDYYSKEGSYAPELVVTTGGEVIDVTNLALSATAYASSAASGYEAANAIDDDLATRWGSSYTDDEYIYLDLGQTAVISQVTLYWETAYGEEYEIQVSDDASSWTTIYSTSSGDGGTDDITGLSATGQYIRMQGISRGTSWGYSLYEFEVYGYYSGSSKALGKSDISSRNELLSMFVYPNPCPDGMLNIYIEGMTTDVRTSLDIYDLAGRVLISKNTGIEKVTSINISGLKEGVYIIKLQKGSGTVIQKFVVN